MAVSQQSYSMLGLIGTNNNDLIKGIDRASSTTIAALQTAVVAAQTLANQALVLNRINGVQAAAGSLIGRASASTSQGNQQLDLAGTEEARQVAPLQSAFAEEIGHASGRERRGQEG